MKRLCLLLLGLLLAVSAVRGGERRSELLNFDWRFRLGEQPGADRPGYDDSAWETVQLPHDASIYGPFVRDTLGGDRTNGFRPRHAGWYRKHLTIVRKSAGRRFLLELEGVYRAAEVWVNGVRMGQQLNGYLDFEYDVTDALHEGDNLVAVRYDNRYKGSSRWYTGEGINRNVWLHEVSDLRVDRYGTFVSTPRILPDSARVAIETTVRNDRPDSVVCTVVSEVLSPSGGILAVRRSVVPMAGGGRFTFRQQTWVRDPQLWELETPRLYAVRTRVEADGRQTDLYETPFGIRDVEMTPEAGLKLNGRKVFVKGVCLHHDLGALGTAAFEDGFARRLERLKQMGCNAIRLSHNVFPKCVLEWCDRNGMLVYDEMYDKWSGQFYGEGADFERYWRRDMGLWLQRDRNHPSVFIWSVGNEVQQTRNSKVRNFATGRDEIDSTRGVRLWTQMYDHVRYYDPTRMVTTALFPTRYNGIRAEDAGFDASEPAQLSFYMDVMSVNYRERFFARDREKYPQLIYIVSEIATGEGGYSYFGYDHASAVGQFYWGGTEYIGESFGWPSKGWINGAADLCDNLKPVGWSIRSLYSDEPMVRIAVHDKTAATERVWNDLKMRSKPMHLFWKGEPGDTLDVQTFSNCEEVELRLNGCTLGRRRMADCPKQRMIWRVAYQPGELTAVGYDGARKVAEQRLCSASKPVRLVLRPERTRLCADGMSLLYANVEVQDAAGTVVPTSDFDVRFEVEGPATIAGVCNGDITSDELWQADRRHVHEGRALVILRAGREAGTIRVTARARGLKPDRFVVESRPPAL